MSWATKTIATLTVFLKVQVASLRELLAIGREGSPADDAAGEAAARELRAVRESIAAEKTLVMSGPPREVIDVWEPDHFLLPEAGASARGKHRLPPAGVRVLVPSTQRTIPVVRTDDKPPWSAAEYPLAEEEALAGEAPPGPVTPDPEPEPEPETPAEPPEENPWPGGRGLTGSFQAIDDYIGKLPDLGDSQE